MPNEPKRIMRNKHWYYLYTIDNVTDYYTIAELAACSDCLVDKSVLAVRISGLFKGRTSMPTIYDCMVKPLLKTRVTKSATLGDFDLLYKLWR